MTTNKSGSKAAKPKCVPTSEEQATSGDFVARQSKTSEHIVPGIDVVRVRSLRRGPRRRQACVDQASHH
jgi:hypothetical protein